MARCRSGNSCWRLLGFEPLEPRMYLDAGVASVTGTVFEDLDGDGIFDAEEPGLAGFQVELEPVRGHLRSFKAPHNSLGDEGLSVAIRGDRYLVGVADFGRERQTAHLFDLSTGEMLQTFHNPNPEIRSYFGYSVAFVGNNVLVGAPLDVYRDPVGEEPFAYLFDGTTGELLQSFMDPRPSLLDPPFSLAAVDNRILIGELGDRAAYLFDTTSGELLRTFSIRDGAFPRLVMASAFIGDDVLVATGDALYLFDADTGEQLRSFPKPASAGGFGGALAVSGRTILVSGWTGAVSSWKGSAYLLDADTGQILQTFEDPLPASRTLFGSSVAFLGNDVVIGAPGRYWDTSGAAYLFDTYTGELLETFRNPVPNRHGKEDGFGRCMAVEGDYLLVGADAFGRDQVHLFTTSATTGTTTTSAIADADGKYRFDELLSGGYVVRAIVPEGYSQTFPDGDGTHTIVVGDGEELSGLHFGMANMDPPPVIEPTPVPRPTPIPEPVPEPMPPRAILPVEPPVIVNPPVVPDPPLVIEPVPVPVRPLPIQPVPLPVPPVIVNPPWVPGVPVIPDPPSVVEPDPVPELPAAFEPAEQLRDLLIEAALAGYTDWFAQAPASAVARPVPETAVYQSGENPANRAVEFSFAADRPAGDVSTQEFFSWSESERARRVDVALRDWESDLAEWLEVKWEQYLSDSPVEVDLDPRAFLPL